MANVCDPRTFARLSPLPREFYDRDPRIVARALLGKILIRGEASTSGERKTTPGGFGKTLRAGRIVETEAYLGTNDAAAHAAAGLTQRNAVLFGPPGHAYVYLSYGLHYCLNVSCLPKGRAGCVLIRALEPLAGIEAMARARGLRVSEGAPFKPGFGLSGKLPRGNSATGFRSVSALDAPKIPTQTKGRFEWGTQNFPQLRLLCSGPARLCQAFEITRERDNGSDLARPQPNGLWIADDGYVFNVRRIATSARVGITKSAELDLRYYVPESEFVSR